MAERRMFSKSVIDSDMLLDMPLSAQALYFHLSMRADDDGFVNNPKKIQRMVGASDDDCKILVAKKFIIPFESGIVVIRHWKIHNYIQKDRYKETVYLDEKAQISTDRTGAYVSEPCPTCIQPVSKVETQVSIGQVSIGKKSIDKDSRGETAENPPPAPASSGKKKFIPPTLDEVAAYCNERHNHISPSAFIDYYEARGWKYGTGKPMVNWKAAVRTWEQKEKGRTHTQGEQQKKATEEVNARIFEELFGGEPT